MPSIDKAYKWAIKWCNKPKVGYSQPYRNKKVVRGITYFDCSSFINYALVAGGFKTPKYAPNYNAFNTDSEPSVLTDLGFTRYTTDSSFEWKAGDIGLNPHTHTEMCYKGGVGRAIFMGAHGSINYTLPNQVSISTKTRTFPVCFRYKAEGAIDNGFSMYVISAICGNFWQESGVNPGVWQNLNEPGTESTAYTPWDSDTTYSVGSEVSYGGHNYHAKLRVPRVIRPTNTAYWKEVTSTSSYPSWTSGASYSKGERVSYSGNKYEATTHVPSTPVYPSNDDYWSDEGEYHIYSKWESLNHGFGLGQWTNTGGDRHGRLYKLHEYSVDHGGDGSMEAQASYILQENVWHKGTSYQQSVPYNTLDEFIHSDSEDIDELTKAWFYCWEGIDDGTLSTRQANAKKVYEFLLDHEGDESTSYQSSNTYLSDSQRLQNSLALFNLFGGVVIHDGVKQHKVRQMPVWMMIRYHY